MIHQGHTRTGRIDKIRLAQDADHLVCSHAHYRKQGLLALDGCLPQFRERHILGKHRIIRVNLFPDLPGTADQLADTGRIPRCAQNAGPRGLGGFNNIQGGRGTRRRHQGAHSVFHRVQLHIRTVSANHHQVLHDSLPLVIGQPRPHARFAGSAHQQDILGLFLAQRLSGQALAVNGSSNVAQAGKDGPYIHLRHVQRHQEAQQVKITQQAM